MSFQVERDLVDHHLEQFAFLRVSLADGAAHASDLNAAILDHITYSQLIVW